MTEAGPDQPPRRRRRSAPAGSEQPAKAGRGRQRDGADRGLRDLVGGGASQLGVQGALRGRDVNRPTDEDIAKAEREVVIVRRNWKPPA